MIYRSHKLLVMDGQEDRDRLVGLDQPMDHAVYVFKGSILSKEVVLKHSQDVYRLIRVVHVSNALQL